MIRVEGFSSVHFNLEEQVCVSKLISAFSLPHFCVSLAGMAFAEKLTKVPTAWMDEHETFLIWYAKKKARAGTKKLVSTSTSSTFGSGMDILNALPSGSWVFAGMGGVPAMMGNLRYGTSVIAIGNSVLVRPDRRQSGGYNKAKCSPRHREGQDLPDHDRFLRPLRPELLAQGPGLDGQDITIKEYGPGPGSGRV